MNSKNEALVTTDIRYSFFLITLNSMKGTRATARIYNVQCYSK